MDKASLPKVVIVGCGFGGLAAARALKNAAADVTVIDRTNHHLFQPLLYQVATAGLAAPSIAAPIRHMLRRQRNTTVLMADVTGIDREHKTLKLNDGQSLAYDYLIIASGATHSYFGHDEWAAHAPGLKTLFDAHQIRSRILHAFENAELEPDAEGRTKWLTFVVIGGGPTGVEMAGTLAEIARHTLKHEFRRFQPGDARILLLEGADRLLTAYPADLSRKALAQLQSLGVEVRLNSLVTNIGAEQVNAGSECIDTRTIIWAAGVAASPLGTALGVPLDRSGRIKVSPDLSAPGVHNVFVIGDLASIACDNKPVPGTAPAAKQMGRCAAGNVLRLLRNEKTAPFRYRDYGLLATIGRNAGVAAFAGMKLSGYPAWLLWLSAHIFFLIGFRNRFVVMMDWAWSYWTMQRQARIIIERHEPERPRTP